MTTDFRSELLARGLLIETGVDGLYGRSGTFENVVRGIDDLVTAAGADQGASVLHFPAVIPRTVLERSGYPKSFPDLLGSVSVFEGGEEMHAELLERAGTRTGLERTAYAIGRSFCSAACHPLYPYCSGRLPAGGRRFEVFGHCFRHEPSLDPARMQMFRQHEFVYLGDPDSAVAIATFGSNGQPICCLDLVLLSKRWSRTTPSSGEPGGCSPPINAPKRSSTRSSVPSTLAPHDCYFFFQLSRRPFRERLQHRSGGRRGCAHGLCRIRRRAHRPRLAGHARI